MSAAAAPRRAGKRTALEPAIAPTARSRVRRLAGALVGADAGVRYSGLLFPGVIFGHSYWLPPAFNTDDPVMASVFLAGIAIVDVYSLLSIVNSWQVARPVLRRLESGAEPTVAVLIPTCGEPIEMVLATLRSVLEQDWPHDRL